MQFEIDSDHLVKEHKIIIAIGSSLLLVLLVVFMIIIARKARNEHKKMKKLHQFNRLPKSLLDEDSFILKDN